MLKHLSKTFNMTTVKKDIVLTKAVFKTISLPFTVLLYILSAVVIKLFKQLTSQPHTKIE